MKPRRLLDYPGLLRSIILRLFRPLMKYKGEKAQDIFLVKRNGEATDLRNAIEEATPYGSDVWLIGVKGGGKTLFLKWFLKTPRFSGDTEDRHLFVDLSKTESLRLDKVFEERVREIMIEIIRKYFEKVGGTYRAAIHGLKGSARTTYDSAVELILRYRKGKKPLLLFLDDIDYCNHFLPILVRLTRPFRDSEDCVVIQAVRNPAYNAIMSCADYPIGQLAVNAIPVKLSRFRPQQILIPRLNLICDGKKIGLREKVNTSTTLGLFEDLLRKIVRFFEEADKIQDQSKAQERRNIQTIKPPFTNAQYDFIESMSNSNITYMEMLGKEMMECLVKNRSEVTEQIDGYNITDQAIFDHFTQTEIDKISIQNLNKNLSNPYQLGKPRRQGKKDPKKIGNSLYVLLLEFLMEHSSISLTDAEFLKEYGFEVDELGQGLSGLFKMELIDEKTITYEKALGGPNATGPREYYVTSRGRYYLRFLLHWPEYTQAFLQSTHHRIGAIKARRNVLKDLLVDFVMKIFLTKEDLGHTENELKISRENFVRYFLDLHQQALRRIFKVESREELPITVRSVTFLLSELRIIETRRSIKPDNYLFCDNLTRLACNARGIPWAKRAPYDKHFFRNITEGFTKTPKSYTQKKSKEK